MAYTHGASGYRSGCRCKICCAGNTAQQRKQRAKDITKRSNVVAMKAAQKSKSIAPVDNPSAPATASPEPKPLGDNKIAVIEELELLPKASERPSIAMQARTLARILDDPDLQPMHATTSRQLQALLAALVGPQKKSRGRLAAVQTMHMHNRKAQ